jgi:hypothetical protein
MTDLVPYTPQEVERPDDTDQALALVDAARQQLAQAETLQDFTSIAKKAEAIRYLTKKAGLALAATNAAARLKVDAERRCGAMLLELKQAGEYGPGRKSSIVDDLPAHVVTHRWQDMARVPEEAVRLYLTTQEEKGAEITSAAIQHMGARIRRMETVHERDEALHEDWLRAAFQIAAAKGQYQRCLLEPNPTRGVLVGIRELWEAKRP